MERHPTNIDIEKRVGPINSKDSGIENNRNDLVSNQGSSGIKNFKVENRKSRVEREAMTRQVVMGRDEENPMYDSVDDTWGPPDHF